MRRSATYSRSEGAFATPHPLAKARFIIPASFSGGTFKSKAVQHRFFGRHSYECQDHRLRQGAKCRHKYFN